MLKDYVFLDLDGVILDSEQRMLVRKNEMGLTNHTDKSEFEYYFEYTKSHPEEWEYIICGAKPINNSIEVIKKLEAANSKIAILTKIHTTYEMKVKIDVLRKQLGILCPIFFVPPGIKKYQVIIPNNQMLIDDSAKNIRGWIENGGKGLIFDTSIEENTPTRVRSLEFLLKR